ncbi:MAG TPA: tetratricopeptide repeat protein [Candidatus Limnocylindrales bacterium]|nr:tetratricopeptide repeat protein [Candidatus Limnocylindrales bacterium]
MKLVWFAQTILCVWMIAQVGAPLLQAQGGGGVVEGVVRDAERQPLADVKVSLDDQVAGRTEATQTDAAGHFRFSGVTASTYMVRARKLGYVDRAEGPFATRQGETRTLNLEMAVEKSAAPARNAAQAMEYSDEPQFTVAGVTDPSNVGGHGSNVTLPTKEALARETASLGSGTAASGNAGTAKENPGELPIVAAGNFAGNLKAGKDLLQAGRAKQAIDYLERAVKLKPMDYDAAYSLTLAYQKSGDGKRADQMVQTLLAREERAELHGLLGEIREGEGQPVDAVREYQRAAEMEPSEENLFVWGAELLLHHAYAPAAEVFAKGHRLYPKSVRILVGLGSTAYAQDLNEQAARWLLEAIEIAPADPRPYLFLGKLQEVAKSEPQEWAEAFRRFAALRPEDAKAHYYLAVALEKQRRGERDFAAREAELQKAIALDPRLGDAYLKLGVLYGEKGELPKAVASLQKAIELTPLPDEAHLRLAQVYRRMGEMEKARNESQLYGEVSVKKKEQMERERRELGEFVVTGKP